MLKLGAGARAASFATAHRTDAPNGTFRNGRLAAAMLAACLALPSPALAGPEDPIDVSAYMTAAQIADVQAGTQTLDVTIPVQNWLAACVAQHRACRAMPGIYKITGQIVFEQAGNLATGLTVYSDSPGQTIFDSSYTGGAPFILRASGGTPSAPVSSTYAYLSGLAFRCNYAGPCLTIGKPDYSDQINEFTLWRLSVQNSNGSAASTSYEFNAVFSGNVYANGSTAASPGRVATFGTITGGSGYTNGTYTNVVLSGSVEGTLAQANITVSGGKVTAVTLTYGGVLYQTGDTLSATLPGGGSGFSIPVATVTNVQNDIFRIRQSAFTSYKIGGSSGWNFVHLTDTFSYGNTFVTPDCEIVANCYKIDSASAVRNTSIGGTYAYSTYGHGIDASAGSFVAINPNVNATASFMAPGSDVRAALWTNTSVPLVTKANFTAPVTTQNSSGTATVSITSSGNTTNLNEDTSGNFIVNNTKSGGFTVFEQSGPGVLQFKVNGAQVAAMFGTTATFNLKTTAPLVGTSGYTVSTLPSSPSNGDRAFVTDATACTFMLSVTGGGSTPCPVIYLSGWKAG